MLLNSDITAEKIRNAATAIRGIVRSERNTSSERGLDDIGRVLGRLADDNDTSDLLDEDDANVS